MNVALPLGRLSYILISFIILLTIVPAILNSQSNVGRLVAGQEANSSIVSDAEILASINQTYLSLIPLMIQEVENTNASDIPIRQIIEATPSNVTALQDIVKNSSNKSAPSELNSTFSNGPSSSINSSTTTTTPPKPQDLIPVVVNMTQNTNASDLGIMRIINSTPNLDTINLTAID